MLFWYRRNQARFQDRFIHWKSTINLIISDVSLLGNNTRHATVISITEFITLKALRVDINPHPTKKEKLLSSRK